LPAPPDGRWTPLALAEELARQQRSISIAEFFEKNKHLLGFDSPTRGIITTIKEAVDNALDACEEAEVLPDVEIEVRRTGPETFRVAVEDNGPGIVPENVPFVFGKLLYGSRFHQIRQSRGQQGIGISAAVLYAQLTTGLPAVITTRTGALEPAHRFSPDPGRDERARDPRARRGRLGPDPRDPGRDRVPCEPRGEEAARRVPPFDRRGQPPRTDPGRDRRRCLPLGPGRGRAARAAEGDQAPPARDRARAARPDGRGLEGHARAVPGRPVRPVGAKTAEEICTAADLTPSSRVENLSGEDVSRLLAALQSVRVPPPPTTQCLSPIGEELLVRGLSAEYRMDFVAARTRPSAVYGGHPFMVEAALGYGASSRPRGTRS